jgi:hypothetical protein
MTPHLRGRCLVGAAVITGVATPLHALQPVSEDIEQDVRVFHEHVTFLASPYLEGRVPGSHGMEVAKDYSEHYLREAGLEPGFVAEGGAASFRQAFPLGGTSEVESHSIALISPSKIDLEGGTDFTATSMGSSGEASGKLVFVGYSIDNGPEGYSSFEEGDDLTGKIAVMLRFEPVNGEGGSRWNDRTWSGRAGFSNKLRSITGHNPAAVIIVNTPGTNDDRANSLISPDLDAGAGQALDVPVFHMTTEAGDRLIKAASADKSSLMDLRKQADEGRAVVEFDAQLGVAAEISHKPLIAENVAGLLPGKGDLAGELVVIGAHLDHLGMGNFGSRSGPGKLHPGADDNASGSAAIMMLAERLKDDYDNLPDGASARTIVFTLFSAEESGLNGSRYYVDNPIVPIDKHVFMINFDMIGRIVEAKLSLNGVGSAEGMSEWLTPILEKSPLEIVENSMLGGGSDHVPFNRAGVPYLFAICTPLHADYHTPEDLAYKINDDDAVHTIHLFHDILLAVATQPGPFVYAELSSGRAGQAPRFQRSSVRFGIMPGQPDPDVPGVVVSSISEGGSAEAAGIKAGDVLQTWNGAKIEDVQSWIQMLTSHKPGDEVDVGVMRGEEVLTIKVTLKAREEADG